MSLFSFILACLFISAQAQSQADSGISESPLRALSQIQNSPPDSDIWFFQSEGHTAIHNFSADSQVTLETNSIRGTSVLYGFQDGSIHRQTPNGDTKSKRNSDATSLGTENLHDTRIVSDVSTDRYSQVTVQEDAEATNCCAPIFRSLKRKLARRRN
ncbi:hypothetical protein ROZALSC1DRAFT_20834 [Rozella allomycis CSF55]|uniref:Uncharacterized protein n=1 Tax=Rozella allomycis (strain CSF55) TaxID=988480 RepID=A0A4P9YMY0_ROZAC|nr:hypothetical protein ROZALSC1DRAFT_20834 [Rozella allomycis CSF55]